METVKVLLAFVIVSALIGFSVLAGGVMLEAIKEMFDDE